MAMGLFYGRSPFVVGLSNHELVNPVGWVSTHLKLIPTKFVLRRIGLSATSALHGRAGPVTFGIAPKATKNASPCTPLNPPVLATRGMRQRHTKASLTLRTVCADDASTTARCSAPRRGLKGQFEPMFDRCAMRIDKNLATNIARPIRMD